MSPNAPSLDEIVRLTQVLGGAEIVHRPRRELLDAVGRLLEDHPFVVSRAQRPPVKYWRGRAASADGFAYVGEMIQPPPDKCTRYARCSGPGQSLFYAAMTPHTVFSELEASAGDYVQIVVVAPKDGCDLKIAHIGEIDHWRRYGRSILSDPHVDLYLRHTFPNPDWSDREVRRMLVDAFMADVFSRDGGKPGAYEVSSAIADHYLAAGVDAIAYPSVRHRGGLNIAFHPRCAEQMGIAEFALFQIENDLGYGLFKKRFVKDGSYWENDGKIIWNKH